jgi:hypothetical protein
MLELLDLFGDGIKLWAHRLRRDVLKLPPLHQFCIGVPMTANQLELYQEYKQSNNPK